MKQFLFYMIKAMSTYYSTVIAKRNTKLMRNCEHMQECDQDGARSNVIDILNINANSMWVKRVPMCRLGTFSRNQCD